MSPSDLEVLVHCHAIPGEHPRINVPAVRDAIQRFLADGIISPVSEGGKEIYITTNRGRRWLEMILETPYPVQEWIDPRGSR